MQEKTTKSGHSPGGAPIKSSSPYGHEEMQQYENVEIAPEDQPTDGHKEPSPRVQKPPAGEQPQNPKHADHDGS